MHIAECLEIGTASKGKTIDEAAINFKMATKLYRGGGQHRFMDLKKAKETSPGEGIIGEGHRCLVRL